MKKIIIFTLLLCLLSVPAMANPYSLYGNGNCAYFAWELLDLYSPVGFNVPRDYNAKDWVKLDGQERDGYELRLYDEPMSGDFAIFAADVPGQSGWRGHVAFVESVEEKILFNFRSGKVQTETWVNVVESNDYAEKKYYPFTYKDCYFGYGRILFERDGANMFREDDVKFLRLVESEI